MPFDGNTEAKSLSKILDASEISGIERNTQVSAKFLDEAHREFCKLNPEKKAATIAAISPQSKFEISDKLSLLTDGDNKAIGAISRTESGVTRSFLSFDCSDVK